MKTTYWRMLSAVVLLLGCVGTVSADLNHGLVAHYPFDGDTLDASGNGHDGVLVGATLTTDRFGNPDKAYFFDGINADRIVIPNDPALSPAQLSLVAWIKPVESAHNSQIIIHNFSAIGIYGGYEIAFRYPEKRIVFGLYRSQPDYSWVDIDFNFVADNWHLLVGTYDGQTMRLYVDGVPLGTIVNTQGYVESIQDSMTIGINSHIHYLEPNHYFAGSIDDIRIYNRALSPEEIQQIYSIQSVNEPPIANAGENQSVHPGIVALLDGSASYDPEGGTLDYNWALVDVPDGSTTELVDSTSVNASFTPDLLGEYVVELVVTDEQGATASTQTRVSTFNTAPVAIAGDDQVILHLGTAIELNGANSYDDDGDSMTYAWSFYSLPADSQTELLINNSDPTHVSFVPDVYGDYFVELVVTDVFGASSDPGDLVQISFDNVPPVADAGSNQSVVAGDNVYLDGTSSFDANGDLLSYHWRLISKPIQSDTDLDDASSATPQFFADQPGNYIVTLMVNDGFLDSDPSHLTIVAVSEVNSLTQLLRTASGGLNDLADTEFKFNNARRILTTKINFALWLVDNERFRHAHTVLQWLVARRMNGCALRGSPDKTWDLDIIVTCQGQNQVYPYIKESIGLLEPLLNNQ